MRLLGDASPGPPGQGGQDRLLGGARPQEAQQPDLLFGPLPVFGVFGRWKADAQMLPVATTPDDGGLKAPPTLANQHLLNERFQEAVAGGAGAGSPPLGEIAERLEVSLPLVYRALAEAGLRPHQTAEAARAREE